MRDVRTAGDGTAVPRTTRRPTAARRERGSQAVELALVTPFVLLLLAAVLAAALVGVQQVAAQQLAGVAARAAAVEGDAAVRERVARIAGPDVVVELAPPEGVRRDGDLVEVEVRVPPPVPPAAVPDGFTLVGRAVVRVEDDGTPP